MLTLLSISVFSIVAIWVAHVAPWAIHLRFRMPSGEISLCDSEKFAGKYPCFDGEGSLLWTTLSVATYEHVVRAQRRFASSGQRPGVEAYLDDREPIRTDTAAIVEAMRDEEHGMELVLFQARNDGVDIVYRCLETHFLPGTCEWRRRH